MSYKVVRKNEAVSYEPPRHFNMLATRLHNPQDVKDGKMIMGLSHFLPGGGCEFGSIPMETIYYIVSGEMTLKTETEETVLYVGDTFHCGKDTKKSVVNNGCETSMMLMCIVQEN